MPDAANLKSSQPAKPNWFSCTVTYNQLNTGNESIGDIIEAQGPVFTSFISPLSVFRCPSDTGPDLNSIKVVDGTNGSGAAGTNLDVEVSLTNYVGLNNTRFLRAGRASTPNAVNGAVGCFARNTRTRFRDMTDGSSNTIMVSERAWKINSDNEQPKAAIIADVIETATPNGGTSVEFPAANRQFNGLSSTLGSVYQRINAGCGNDTNSGCHEGLSSLHNGGVHALMGDGRVRFISQNIQHNLSDDIDSLLEYLIAYNDGNTVGEF